MAIKGKSKSRGGKARSSAPRPVITERKPPFLARKSVRIAIVAVFGVAAILGALRVWQNKGRSNDLRAYDRALTRSQALIVTHFEEGSLTGFRTSIQEFKDGKLDPKRFRDLAALWEKDFRASKESVAKLKPPKQLGNAQELVVQGIDAYVGIARMYQMAATQREIATESQNVAKAEKDAAQKKKLEAQAKKDADQVQVILLQVGEWQTRADALYSLGIKRITELKVEWGVEKPSTSQPGSSPQSGSAPVGVVAAFAGVVALRRVS